MKKNAREKMQKLMNRPNRRIIQVITCLIVISLLSQNLVWAQGIGTTINIGNLPIIHNALDSIQIPENIGKIKEIWKSEDRENIIHIQDSHANYEAQLNIARILEHLLQDKERFKLPVLICVEGAEGPIDVSVIGSLPKEYNDVKRIISDYLTKAGLMTGAEFYTALNPDDSGIVLWGVEDGDTYLENVRLFKELQKNKEDVKRWIKREEKGLKRLSRNIFTKEQKEYIDVFNRYHNDGIGLEEYAGYLRSQEPGIKNQKGNFGRLLQLVDLKDEIDFSKIEEERMRLIKALKKRLVKEELAGVITKGLNYQVGKISALEYFTYLEELIEGVEGQESQREKNWRYREPEKEDKLANLVKYIDYVKLESRIDRDDLFKELREIENSIRGNLFTTMEQKQIEELYYHLSIINRFIELKIYREDLQYYKEHREGFPRNAFLNNFEKFCDTGIERDKILVKNTITKMRELKANTAILITGGFHTAGVKEYFKDKDISYVVVSPRMIEKQDKERYIELMLEEDPLEKMLAFNGTRVALASKFAVKALSEFRNFRLIVKGLVTSAVLFANRNLGRVLPRNLKLLPGKIVGGVYTSFIKSGDFLFGAGYLGAIKDVIEDGSPVITGELNTGEVIALFYTKIEQGQGVSTPTGISEGPSIIFLSAAICATAIGFLLWFLFLRYSEKLFGINERFKKTIKRIVSGAASYPYLDRERRAIRSWIARAEYNNNEIVILYLIILKKLGLLEWEDLDSEYYEKKGLNSLAREILELSLKGVFDLNNKRTAQRFKHCLEKKYPSVVKELKDIIIIKAIIDKMEKEKLAQLITYIYEYAVARQISQEHLILLYNVLKEMNKDLDIEVEEAVAILKILKKYMVGIYNELPKANLLAAQFFKDTHPMLNKILRIMLMVTGVTPVHELGHIFGAVLFGERYKATLKGILYSGEVEVKGKALQFGYFANLAFGSVLFILIFIDLLVGISFIVFIVIFAFHSIAGVVEILSGKGVLDKYFRKVVSIGIGILMLFNIAFTDMLYSSTPNVMLAQTLQESKEISFNAKKVVEMFDKWISEISKTRTGLPPSHVGDTRPVAVQHGFSTGGFTYDLAHLALRYTRTKDYEKAKYILLYFAERFNRYTTEELRNMVDKHDVHGILRLLPSPSDRKLRKHIINCVDTSSPWDEGNGIIEWYTDGGPQSWLGIATVQLLMFDNALTRSRSQHAELEKFVLELADTIMGLFNPDQVMSAGPLKQDLYGAPKRENLGHIENIWDHYAFFTQLADYLDSKNPNLATKLRKKAEDILTGLKKKGALVREGDIAYFWQGFADGQINRQIPTDVQAWGIASVGPKRLDEVFGTGTAEGMLNWLLRHALVLIDYNKPDGNRVTTIGADFSDPYLPDISGPKSGEYQDKKGRGGVHPMITDEWTAGVIFAMDAMANYYYEKGDVQKAEETFAMADAMRWFALQRAIKAEGMLYWEYATHYGVPTGYGWSTPEAHGGSLSGNQMAFALLGINPFDHKGISTKSIRKIKRLGVYKGTGLLQAKMGPKNKFTKNKPGSSKKVGKPNLPWAGKGKEGELGLTDPSIFKKIAFYSAIGEGAGRILSTRESIGIKTVAQWNVSEISFTKALNLSNTSHLTLKVKGTKGARALRVNVVDSAYIQAQDWTRTPEYVEIQIPSDNQWHEYTVALSESGADITQIEAISFEVGTDTTANEMGTEVYIQGFKFVKWKGVPSQPVPQPRTPGIEGGEVDSDLLRELEGRPSPAKPEQVSEPSSGTATVICSGRCPQSWGGVAFFKDGRWEISNNDYFEVTVQGTGEYILRLVGASQSYDNSPDMYSQPLKMGKTHKIYFRDLQGSKQNTVKQIGINVQPYPWGLPSEGGNATSITIKLVKGGHTQLNYTEAVAVLDAIGRAYYRTLIADAGEVDVEAILTARGNEIKSILESAPNEVLENILAMSDDEICAINTWIDLIQIKAMVEKELSRRELEPTDLRKLFRINEVDTRLIYPFILGDKYTINKRGGVFNADTGDLFGEISPPSAIYGWLVIDPESGEQVTWFDTYMNNEISLANGKIIAFHNWKTGNIHLAAEGLDRRNLRNLPYGKRYDGPVIGKIKDGFIVDSKGNQIFEIVDGVGAVCKEISPGVWHMYYLADRNESVYVKLLLFYEPRIITFQKLYHDLKKMDDPEKKKSILMLRPDYLVSCVEELYYERNNIAVLKQELGYFLKIAAEIGISDLIKLIISEVDKSADVILWFSNLLVEDKLISLPLDDLFKKIIRESLDTLENSIQISDVLLSCKLLFLQFFDPDVDSTRLKVVLPIIKSDFGLRGRFPEQHRNAIRMCLFYAATWWLQGESMPRDAKLEIERTLLETVQVQDVENYKTRRYMILYLYTIRDSLREESQQRIDKLMAEIRDKELSKTPPYDRWFNPVFNPEQNINIRVYFPESCKVFTSTMEELGYSKIGIDGVTTTFTKEIGGKVVKVEFMCIDVSKVSIFEDMANPDIHVIIYDGHSGMGANLLFSFQKAPYVDIEQSEKLIVIDSCNSLQLYGGLVKDRYPYAQFLGTKTSSYFGTSAVLIDAMVPEFFKRSSWDEIGKAIEDVMNKRIHRVIYSMPNDPDQLKSIDSDGDGLPDGVDTSFDVGNNIVVLGNINRFEFISVPIEAQSIGSDKVRDCITSANYFFSWDEFLRDVHIDISGNGWFQSHTDSRKPLQLSIYREPEENRIEVSVAVNTGYANLSIGALKSIFLYELNKAVSEFKAEEKTGKEDFTDIDKIRGVQLVAKYLKYFHREELFPEFLQFYNLPIISLDMAVESIEDGEVLNEIYNELPKANLLAAQFFKDTHPVLNKVLRIMLMVTGVTPVHELGHIFGAVLFGERYKATLKGILYSGDVEVKGKALLFGYFANFIFGILPLLVMAAVFMLSTEYIAFELNTLFELSILIIMLFHATAAYIDVTSDEGDLDKYISQKSQGPSVKTKGSGVEKSDIADSIEEHRGGRVPTIINGKDVPKLGININKIFSELKAKVMGWFRKKKPDDNRYVKVRVKDLNKDVGSLFDKVMGKKGDEDGEGGFIKRSLIIPFLLASLLLSLLIIATIGSVDYILLTLVIVSGVALYLDINLWEKEAIRSWIALRKYDDKEILALYIIMLEKLGVLNPGDLSQKYYHEEGLIEGLEEDLKLLTESLIFFGAGKKRSARYIQKHLEERYPSVAKEFKDITVIKAIVDKMGEEELTPLFYYLSDLDRGDHIDLELQEKVHKVLEKIAQGLGLGVDEGSIEKTIDNLKYLKSYIARRRGELLENESTKANLLAAQFFKDTHPVLNKILRIMLMVTGVTPLHELAHLAGAVLFRERYKATLKGIFYSGEVEVEGYALHFGYLENLIFSTFLALVSVYIIINLNILLGLSINVISSFHAAAGFIEICFDEGDMDKYYGQELQKGGHEPGTKTALEFLQLWVSGECSGSQILESKAETDNELQRAGIEKRIFALGDEEDLAKQVKIYSAERTSPARQLPFMEEKEQKRLSGRMSEVWRFHQKAIGFISDEELVKLGIRDISASKIRQFLAEGVDRYAVVYDEKDNPFFYLKGLGEDDFIAVTSSSGRDLFDSYRVSSGYNAGRVPRTIYTKLSYIEGYMGLGDEGVRAYMLHLLQGVKDVGDKVKGLVYKNDKKIYKAWAEKQEKARKAKESKETGKVIAEVTSANLGKFFAGGVIPKAIIKEVEAGLDRLVKEDILVDYKVFANQTDLHIYTTRSNEWLNEDGPFVVRNIIDVIVNALGMEDVSNLEFKDQVKALEIRRTFKPLKFTERTAEPIAVVSASNTYVGAFNLFLWRVLCDPMTVAGLTIDPAGDRGFMVEVWDSVENKTYLFDSITENKELRVLISEPGRYAIVAAYPKKEHKIASDEPVVAVSVKRIFDDGKAPVGDHSPVVIIRSQSGLPAWGELIEGFAKGQPIVTYGGDKTRHMVAWMPVRIDKARAIKRPVTLSILTGFGYQSNRNGRIGEAEDIGGDKTLDVTREQADRWNKLLESLPAELWDIMKRIEPFLRPYVYDRDEEISALKKKWERGEILDGFERNPDTKKGETDPLLTDSLDITFSTVKVDIGSRPGHFKPHSYTMQGAGDVMEIAKRFGRARALGYIQEANRLKVQMMKEYLESEKIQKKIRSGVINWKQVTAALEKLLIKAWGKEREAEAKALGISMMDVAGLPELLAKRKDVSKVIVTELARQTHMDADVWANELHSFAEAELAKSAPSETPEDVLDYKVWHAGDDIQLTIAHRKGVEAGDIHTLAFETFIYAAECAGPAKVYGYKQDILVNELVSGNVQGAGPGYAEICLKEGDSVVNLSADKTAPGAFTVPFLYWTQKAIKDGGFPNGVIAEIWAIEGHQRTFLDLSNPDDFQKALKLLRAPELFAIKRLWSSKGNKKIDRVIASASTERLVLVAGEYVGKDDPTMYILVGNNGFSTDGIIDLWQYPLFALGFMRGSHMGPIMPDVLGKALPHRFDGPPPICGWIFNGVAKGQGGLGNGVDAFKGRTWLKKTQDDVNFITDVLRALGFMPPHKVEGPDTEYTTSPKVKAALEARGKAQDAGNAEEELFNEAVKDSANRFSGFIPVMFGVASVATEESLTSFLVGIGFVIMGFVIVFLTFWYLNKIVFGDEKETLKTKIKEWLKKVFPFLSVFIISGIIVPNAAYGYNGLPASFIVPFICYFIALIAFLAVFGYLFYKLTDYILSKREERRDIREWIKKESKGDTEWLQALYLIALKGIRSVEEEDWGMYNIRKEIAESVLDSLEGYLEIQVKYTAVRRYDNVNQFRIAAAEYIRKYLEDKMLDKVGSIRDEYMIETLLEKLNQNALAELYREIEACQSKGIFVEITLNELFTRNPVLAEIENTLGIDREIIADKTRKAIEYIRFKWEKALLKDEVRLHLKSFGLGIMATPFDIISIGVIIISIIAVRYLARHRKRQAFVRWIESLNDLEKISALYLIALERLGLLEKEDRSRYKVTDPIIVEVEEDLETLKYKYAAGFIKRCLEKNYGIELSSIIIDYRIKAVLKEYHGGELTRLYTQLYFFNKGSIEIKELFKNNILLRVEKELKKALGIKKRDKSHRPEIAERTYNLLESMEFSTNEKETSKKGLIALIISIGAGIIAFPEIGYCFNGLLNAGNPSMYSICIMAAVIVGVLYMYKITIVDLKIPAFQHVERSDKKKPVRKTDRTSEAVIENFVEGVIATTDIRKNDVRTMPMEAEIMAVEEVLSKLNEVAPEDALRMLILYSDIDLKGILAQSQLTKREKGLISEFITRTREKKEISKNGWITLYNTLAESKRYEVIVKKFEVVLKERGLELPSLVGRRAREVFAKRLLEGTIAKMNGKGMSLEQVFSIMIDEILEKPLLVVDRHSLTPSAIKSIKKLIETETDIMPGALVNTEGESWEGVDENILNAGWMQLITKTDLNRVAGPNGLAKVREILSRDNPVILIVPEGSDFWKDIKDAAVFIIKTAKDTKSIDLDRITKAVAQEIQKGPLSRENVKDILIKAGYKPEEAEATATDSGIDLSAQRIEESRKTTEHLKSDNTLREQL